MPREKPTAIMDKPVSTATRGRKPKGISAANAVVTKRKPRRSPYEVVKELRARRDELAQTYEDRLIKLDFRIKRLEERYEKKILLAQLINSRSPEELALELAAVKKQQMLLKRALKAHR